MPPKGKIHSQLASKPKINPAITITSPGRPSKGPRKEFVPGYVIQGPQKVSHVIGQQNKPKPPKPKGKGPWVWSNLNNRWTHPWCK